MVQKPPLTLPDVPFRGFVALNVGEHVRGALASVIHRLRREAPAGISWVPPENLHVSMAFLGEVFPDAARLLCLALEEAAGATAVFRAEVVGVGCFGPPSHPRVIWAGVQGGSALAGLHVRVARGVTGCGIALDARPFHGHITLGRVKTAHLPVCLLHRLGELQQEVFGNVRVGSVDLMRSTLSPLSARYDRLRRFEFRENPSR